MSYRSPCFRKLQIPGYGGPCQHRNPYPAYAHLCAMLQVEGNFTTSLSERNQSGSVCKLQIISDDDPPVQH